MKNYKIGDEVLVKGRIEKIDAEDYEYTYRVVFDKDNDSGVSSTCWPYNDNIVESDKTYEDGLRDAWEMALIYSYMENSERDKIFNGITDPGCFFDLNYWTPGEAIHRYNEKTVRPGDVVYINGESNLGNKFVVLAINNKLAYGYAYCTDKYSFRIQDISHAIGNMKKTGEHVDLSYLTNGGVKKNG